MDDYRIGIVLQPKLGVSCLIILASVSSVLSGKTQYHVHHCRFGSW